MDVQQNRSNEENKQVLAVFDGLLPVVWHYFYVMILYSYIVFASFDISPLHKHTSVDF